VSSGGSLCAARGLSSNPSERYPEAVCIPSPAEQRLTLIFLSVAGLEEMLCSREVHIPLCLCRLLRSQQAPWKEGSGLCQAGKDLNSQEGGYACEKSAEVPYCVPSLA
jgi:hypothetical protein